MGAHKLTTVHTRNGAMYLGTGTAVPIAEVVEFSLSISFDTVDDSAMGDSWETRARGANKWAGSANGNFDDGQSLLFDLCTSSTATKAYFYMDRSVTANYYYGTIWPKDVGPSASRTDIAKTSLTFDGTGQLAVH